MPAGAADAEWTARTGQPFVPLHLQHAMSGPLYGPDHPSAMLHAILLLVSSLLFWLADMLVRSLSSDLLIEVPAIAAAWPLPPLAAAALLFMAEKEIVTKLCRWVAQAGWIAVCLASAVYVASAAYAHGQVTRGPEIRGQIVDVDSNSNRHLPDSWTTTIALQDGTSVRTRDYPAHQYGSLGRCLAVQRLLGRFGFAWLRIADAAPLPPALGPGQLHWPVEPVSRADCFSDKPLLELQGTP